MREFDWSILTLLAAAAVAKPGFLTWHGDEFSRVKVKMHFDSQRHTVESTFACRLTFDSMGAKKKEKKRDL